MKYLEDLHVGTRFGGPAYAVERGEMIEFARKWDPRPIHLVETAGEAAGFGGVIASGAYTTSIYTLLTLRARQGDGEHATIAVLAVKSRLPHPVRAGDTLRQSGEITATRESQSRPDAGVVETWGRLTNQDGDVVFETESTSLVQKRPRGLTQPP